MKNLNELGLQELSVNEANIVEGGNKFWDFVVGYLAGTLVDAMVDDWNSRDGSKPASISGRMASMGPY